MFCVSPVVVHLYWWKALVGFVLWNQTQLSWSSPVTPLNCKHTHSVTHSLYGSTSHMSCVYLISVPVLRLRRQSVALHKQTESIKIAERQDDHVIVCPVCSYHLSCHRRSSWFLFAGVGVRVCDARLWVSDGWRLPSVIKHRCECGNVIIILRPHSASSHKHTHSVKPYDKSL